MRREEQMFREKMSELGYRLRTDRAFRVWAYNRCQQVRCSSRDTKEINFCISIIRYIYGLDYIDINQQRQKMK